MSIGHWQLEPLQLVPVLALVLVYAARARTLTRKRRPLRRLRRISFGAGVAVLLLALISPLDWYGENRLLWVHMIQHLLLGDLAPLLIVLGLTGAVLRPVLAVPGLRRLRGLAHPLVALPLWTVDLYVWHLPLLYQAALRHDAIHALEHACFFGFGALMWAAVVEPLPGPAWFSAGWKAAYTLVVRVAEMVLANIFIWGGAPFYAYYVRLEHGSAGAALTDQRIAGLVMFVEGSFVTLLAFGWLFMRFVAESEARQRLIERDVDPVVAARAARRGAASARARELSR